MKILGIEFNKNAKMSEVIKELNKRGVYGDTIPFHYHQARHTEQLNFDYSQKSAQDILNEVLLDSEYKDLTK